MRGDGDRTVRISEPVCRELHRRRRHPDESVDDVLRRALHLLPETPAGIAAYCPGELEAAVRRVHGKISDPERYEEAVETRGGDPVVAFVPRRSGRRFVELRVHDGPEGYVTASYRTTGGEFERLATLAPEDGAVSVAYRHPATGERGDRRAVSPCEAVEAIEPPLAAVLEGAESRWDRP